MAVRSKISSKLNICKLGVLLRSQTWDGGHVRVLWGTRRLVVPKLSLMCTVPHPHTPRLALIYEYEQCYCGTADEFDNAVSSDKCGTSYPTLCTGDATTACGGFGAIRVYERTGDAAPFPTVASTGTTYSLVGCFADAKEDRVMEDMVVGGVMSAEVRLCGVHLEHDLQTASVIVCLCSRCAASGEYLVRTEQSSTHEPCVSVGQKS